MASDTTNRLISLIFTLRHLVLEHIKPPDSVNPVSLLRLETLRYVEEKPSPTMRELADYFAITPPSATVLVNSLVKARQLKRVPDRADRRIVRLTTTPFGRKIAKGGLRDITGRIKRLLIHLEEKDRQVAIKIFEKLSKIYNH